LGPTRIFESFVFISFAYSSKHFIVYNITLRKTRCHQKASLFTPFGGRTEDDGNYRGKLKDLTTDCQGRISWGIHGLAMVSLGFSRPNHLTPCGRTPLKRPYRFFQGWPPAGQMPCRNLTIPLATPCCTGLAAVHRVSTNSEKTLKRVLELI
jgi:hypothetical protein